MEDDNWRFDETDACKTPEQAKDLMNLETARISALEGKEPGEVRAIVLSNIGYLSGYYDPKRMRDIQELLNTAHPIFGRSVPTPEETYAAGRDHVAQLEEMMKMFDVLSWPDISRRKLPMNNRLILLVKSRMR